MEAIDTQRRFEELISELERLKDTAGLIEENASNTEELSNRTADILEELGELVPSVGETVDKKVQLLQRQVENLEELREKHDTLLDQAESEHQSRLESLSNTLDDALGNQKEHIEEVLQQEIQRLRQQTENLVQVEENFNAFLDQAKSNHQGQLESLSDTLNEALVDQNEFLRRHVRENEEALDSFQSSLLSTTNTIEQQVVAAQDQIEDAREQTASHTGKLAKQSTRKVVDRLGKMSTQLKKQHRRQMLAMGGISVLVTALIVIQLLGI